ncbi:MAG: hypothetical protein U0894_05455 [Pirellulales bacterium]
MAGNRYSRREWAYIALAMLSGCARWRSEDETTKSSQPQSLGAPILAADTVIVEVAFARLPQSDQASYDAIWTAADEQHFSTEIRKEWNANGMRCGVFGNQLPGPVREALSQKSIALDNQSEDDSQLEVDRSARRLQCRAGRRSKIIVSKKESMAYLMRTGGQVSGQLLNEATCMFGMKAFPKGDGRVRLDLHPEIEHGDLKQKWVGQEGALMQQVSRDRIVIEPLRLEAVLAPGQTLALSATHDLKGLGEHFFNETAAGTPMRTWLLVRLVQTQHDDLFAPDKIATPLTTPGD